MLAAQVLMGIYLTSFVDHQLSHQIESIILDKPLLSKAMAENVILDRMAIFMRSNPEIAEKSSAGSLTFYTDDVIEKIAKNIDPVVRRKVTSSVPQNVRAEVVSVQNMFRQREEGWVAKYLFMREKMLVLDAVRDAFLTSTEWVPDRREATLKALMESDSIKRLVEEKIREVEAAMEGQAEGDNAMVREGAGWFDGDTKRNGGMDEDDRERMREELSRKYAEEVVQMMDTRSSVHKYIVGVYQGSEYHLDTLYTIHSYYRRAAEQGDPVAQCHLALFLRYLGDFVLDAEDRDRADHDSQEWLHKAAISDVAKNRVEELNAKFAAEARRAESREQAMQTKIAKLVVLEEEKIDLIHEVLIKVAERVGKANAIAEKREQKAWAREQEMMRTYREIAKAEASRPVVILPRSQ